MLVAMITYGAQIIIAAFRTFPANAKDRLLPASVAHSTVMLDASSGWVQYSKIKCSGASIICGSAIVPYNNDFLWRLKISHSADMPVTAILRKQKIISISIHRFDSSFNESPSSCARLESSKILRLGNRIVYIFWSAFLGKCDCKILRWNVKDTQLMKHHKRPTVQGSSKPKVVVWVILRR